MFLQIIFLFHKNPKNKLESSKKSTESYKILPFWNKTFNIPLDFTLNFITQAIRNTQHQKCRNVAQLHA